MEPDEERLYWRRRMDELLDQRLSRIQTHIDLLDEKVEQLAVRMAIIVAIGALATIAINIVAPWVLRVLVP